MLVKKCGVVVMIVESHKPQGTPLSSPGAPFVPLVVEWKIPFQSQITESFTEIETLAGEKTSPPDPTRTVVVAADDFCTKATQNKSAAPMAIVVLSNVFTVTKSKHRRFCS